MLNHLENIVKANLHKYNVQTTMFCPACQNILDVKKSVTVDFPGVRTYCLCLSCYNPDNVKRALTAAKHQGKNITVEIYNGKTKKSEVITP